MPLPTSFVGSCTEPRTELVDARWLMAYAAGIDDRNPAYFDTAVGVVGHPLFPVCVEWPVVLAARPAEGGKGLTRDERRRGVHATHDLIIHRLVAAGDRLTTVATVEAVEARPPGAYEVLRLDTVDQAGEPVATTRMGSLFLGVPIDGPPSGEIVPAPRGGSTGGVRLATTPVAIGGNAAHLYTETARIFNPIHTDGHTAERAGLPAPILHGTATLAMAVSEVVRVAAGGDPHRVQRVAGRFGAMVTMPSTVTVRVHRSTATDEGRRQVTFSVANEHGDDAVSHGVVVLGGVTAVHPDWFERETVLAYTSTPPTIVGTSASAYPGRELVDASVSVVLGGTQHAVHASARARVSGAAGCVPSEVGPITVNGSGLSVRVDAPDLGWTGGLSYAATSNTVPLGHRRSHLGGIPGHESRRAGDWGTARVSLSIERSPVDATMTAVRYRTWGIEPIDGEVRGAPSHALPQLLWSMAALDVGSKVFATAEEDADGRARSTFAVTAPEPGGSLETFRSYRPQPVWRAGTRQLGGGSLLLQPWLATGTTVDLTPMSTFAMRGLGFASPTWPHGVWHDELAVGIEQWDVDAPGPHDVYHLHHVSLLSGSEDRRGEALGLLEVLALGPHRPSGLTGFTDGCPTRG